ncbi:uncharacterized protein LOC132757468 [Ruditapes philippinarum]|uniref:uncharacterized protein LOC132757468 n=1 Tax=Ruditapes philippinarum TaxID=129788 RepID=UPI00295B161A|nr:uncharacterized protein LOC132757468 [Ruditapes philippinarum]
MGLRHYWRDTPKANNPPPEIKKRHWLKPFVFLTCVTGFLLQLIAVIYIWVDFCDTVPKDRSYCKGENDSSRNYTIQEAEGVGIYAGFTTFVLMTLFFELFTLIMVSCKIKYCVKHICVPGWVNLWECCVCCEGNGWFIMAGIGTFFKMISIIIVCATIPFDDMISYFVGFRIVFANMWFGFIQLVLWCAYMIHRKSCCPDAAYFLGSNRRLSEGGIKVIRIVNEKTVNEQGRLISKRAVVRINHGIRDVQPACVHI